MLYFGVLLIVAIFIVLVIVGTGVAAFRVNSTFAASVCEVISRVTFVAAILTIMLVAVPRLRELFIGFGVELPSITLLVFTCANWNLWQSIVIGHLMVGGLVADGILFAIFHKQKSTRRTTQWCSFAITLFLTTMLFFVIIALSMPTIGLLNDLS